MTTEPIRIGVVGCGRILPAHLRGYRRLREVGFDGFRITGLTSRQPADAAMFRKRGEGPPPREPVSRNPNDPLGAPHLYVSDFQPEVEAEVFPSLEAMLAAGAVDAVLVLAPLHLHHTITLTALAAGKHCLVEKPLAITVRTGRATVEAARARGLTLGVVENARYAESARLARWIIDQGLLGEVQMALWWSAGTAEWSPDRIVARTPWRHRKLLAGAGASLDIGVHWFHRLSYLAGAIERIGGTVRTFEPRRFTRDGVPAEGGSGQVTAEVECDVDDAFLATVEFAGGAIGQVAFSWAGHGEATALPDGLTLYGTRGVLKGDRLVLDGGAVHSARALFAERATAADRERYFPFGLTDPFALIALDWLRAIRAGRDPETSGAAGLLDLAASYAVVESSVLGRPVTLAEALDGTASAYQAELDAACGPMPAG